MIFVVDNLYEDENCESFVVNKDLVKLYKTWNKMYTISRYEMFKKSNLIKFRVVYNFVIVQE